MIRGLTCDDWFTFSMNGELYGDRTSIFDVPEYNLRLPDPGYIVYDFPVEISQTFDLILANSLHYRIFLSGGLDSEWITRSLHERGCNLELHTLRYTDNINEEDVLDAQAIADDLGLPLQLHDLNPYEYRSTLLETAHRYQCTQPVYLSLMKVAAELLEKDPSDKRPFLCSGEIYCQRHWQTNCRNPSWYVVFREDEDACFYRWSRIHGVQFLNDIYMYTPEALISYLLHPPIPEIISGKIPGKLSLITSKYSILSPIIEKSGLKVTAPKKRTGYERAAMLNYELQEFFRNELGYIFHTYKIPARTLTVPYLKWGERNEESQ